MGRINELLKLHQRATDFLDLARRCDKFIAEYRWDLEAYRNASKQQLMSAIYTEADYIKSITRWECVKMRCLRSYNEVLGRISKKSILLLTAPQTTPLTPFTTDMDAQEENEILHDAIGGIKYP